MQWRECSCSVSTGQFRTSLLLCDSLEREENERGVNTQKVDFAITLSKTFEEIAISYKRQSYD